MQFLKKELDLDLKDENNAVGHDDHYIATAR